MRHTGRTHVYLGVSRFSGSFTLLENISLLQSEVTPSKSHHRRFKFSWHPQDKQTEQVCILAARLTKIETFYSHSVTGSLLSVSLE